MRRRLETRLVNLGAANTVELSGTCFAIISSVLIGLAIASVIAAYFVLAWFIAWGATGYFIRLRYGRTRSHRALRMNASRRILLAEERCASCAYSLVGIPADDDACTLCPECGAAWRLDPTDVAGTRALSHDAAKPLQRTN